MKVVVIGTGQLGSGYLQGLSKITLPLSITAIDPAPDALCRAEQRWNEAGGLEAVHEITWKSTLSDAPGEIDLVIVATSADSRAGLVDLLASMCRVRYWLLEKVLAQSLSQIEKIAAVTAPSLGVWVNTPRRLMPWYKVLREHFVPGGPLDVMRRGGAWGLACNSIHYIDLVAWWSGETLVSIDTKGLDPMWFESKRSGFYEVTGELIARFSGGSRLTLAAHLGAEGEGLVVDDGGKGAWHIDEAKGVAVGPAGISIPGQMEFQSSLTPKLVTAILQHGCCGLPNLKESAQMHAVFLDAMLAHWNQSQNRNDTIVPIT